MSANVTGVYPSTSTIDALRSALVARLDFAVQDGASIVDRHNAYVDYCLALLFLASGHRPVVDPFPDPDLFALASGCLLIADKAISDEREWRMVALPPTACRQVKTYLDYLAKLPQRLFVETGDPQLPVEIADVLGSNRARLPLFFYLQPGGVDWWRVTPKRVAARLADDWPLHVGMWRHMAATELRRKTGRTDWAALHLGHIDGLQHPLGKTATMSVMDRLEPLAQAMEHVLSERGWVCASPPIKPSRRDREAWCREALSLREPSRRYPPFGHDRRRTEREGRKQRAVPVVREIVARLREAQPERLSREEIEAATAETFALAKVYGLAPEHCMRVLHRYIRRLPTGADALRRVRPIRWMKPEPSPFSHRTLSDFSLLQKLRNAFVGYLKAMGKKRQHCSLAWRLAEIRLSAALFSGLSSADRQRSLQQALPSRLYRLQQQIFVDLPLVEADDPPVYRWFPDPVSEPLLLGLAELRVSKDAPRWPTSKDVDRALAAILKTIDRPVTPARLNELVRNGLILEVPGVVAAVLDGRIAAVSIPLPQWVRVNRGEALLDAAASPSEWPALAARSRPPITAKPVASVTHGEGGRFLSKLRGCLRQIHQAAPVGNVRQNQHRKRSLAALLDATFLSASGWSELAVALASWGWNLCKNGTRAKSNLAYSTVTKYLLDVSTAIYATREIAPFLSLDPLQYEAIYLEILVDAPEDKADYLFGRLLEFHDFLVDTYSVEDPDWAVVAAAAGRNMANRHADANLLTEDEYLRIFSCLSQHPQLTPSLRTQYASLVLLGYRFNLRFSEAWRLQYRDWQGDPGSSEVYLTIRPNVFGDLKSTAGVRVIPLVDRLTSHEVRVLDALLATGAKNFASDPLAPLMCARAGSRELIGRHEATQSIHAVMRHILGDLRVRYHHLRHTWVTRLAVRALQPRADAPGEGESGKLDLAPLVGDEKGHPLRAIATAVGHASEETTVASYLHSMDWIVSTACQRMAMTMPDLAQSYALQVSPSTIRVRRSRGEPPNANQLPSSVHEPDIATRPYPECPSGTAQTTAARLTPAAVFRIIHEYAASDCSPAQVADRLMETDERIEHVVETARTVERESGYDRYQLHRCSNDPIVSMGQLSGDASPSMPSGAEVRRVSQILERLAQDYDFSDEYLAAGAEAWVRAYRRPHSLLVTDIDDLHALKALLRIVDPNLPCAVTAPDDGARHKNVDLHIGDLEIARIPLAKGALRARRKGRLALTPDVRSGQARTHQTLHRVLFTLATYRRLS